MPYIGGASSDNYIGNVPTTGGIGGAVAGADGADGAAGGSQTFTASGAIAVGDLVGLNPDGTISKIGKYQEAQAYVATGDSTSNVVDNVAVASDGAGTYFLVYNDILNNSNYMTARAATYSDGSWTLGTAVTLQSNAVNTKNYPKVVWNSVKSVFLVYWKDVDNPKLVACSVSGTTITVGSVVQPNAAGTVAGGNYTKWGDIIVEPDTGTVFVCLTTSSAYMRYRGYTCGGTGNRTLTAGTLTDFGVNNSTTYAICMSMSYDTTANRIVFVYNYNATYGLHAVSGTISGTTITLGTNTTAPYDDGVTFAQAAYELQSFYNSTSDTHIVFHDRASESPISVVQFELNGSDITWATTPQTVVTNAGPLGTKNYCYDSDKDRYYIIGRRDDTDEDPQSYVTTVKIIDIDTVSATRGFPIDREYDMANGSDRSDDFVGVCYDATDNIVAMFTRVRQVNTLNDAGKGVVKALNVHTPYETFVGIATEAIADGATGTVTVTGGVNENVTGLTAGEVYRIGTQTGTLEPFKGVVYIQNKAQSSSDYATALANNRRPVGIALSATKILLSPNL